MKLQTPRFGEIDVDQAQIISFPSGVIGFPQVRQYVLLEDDKNAPFQWLQAVEDANLRFLVINPFLFRKDYEFEIPDPILEQIGAEKPEDVAVLAIVTIQPDTHRLTANLQGPVVVAGNTRIAKQLVLVSTPYHTRHDILEEMGVKMEAEPVSAGAAIEKP
ncbi:MAG TPA: flagellar assembly protein FliW [bacterium]|nr:flagellar assembly protein FliW [bacterium]